MPLSLPYSIKLLGWIYYLMINFFLGCNDSEVREIWEFLTLASVGGRQREGSNQGKCPIQGIFMPQVLLQYFYCTVVINKYI